MRTVRRMPGGAWVLSAAALVLLALALPDAAEAQWATSGNNINSTNSGNVGVGPATPEQKLDVDGYLQVHNRTTGHGAFFIRGSSSNHYAYLNFGPGTGYGWQIGKDVGAGTLASPYGLYFYDFTSGATRLAVSTAGNVGIGTTSPAYRLHIAGDNTLAGGYPVIKLQNTQAGGRSWWLYAGAWGVPGALGIYDETAGHYRMFFDEAGNLGVGTTSPSGRLHVVKDSAHNDGSSGALLLRSGASANKGVYAGYDNGIDAGFLQAIDQGVAYKSFLLNPSGGNVGVGLTGTGNARLNVMGADSTAANYSLFVQNGSSSPLLGVRNDGNVGIGTATPAAKLDVAGGINATGTIKGGSIEAKYQDVAEWVPSTQKLSAGTVVTLDPGRSNQVLASTRPYDTGVAGVVSAQPGIALGEAGEGKVLVATTGRVRVRVDATRGPVRIGDLLVTGDREGVAMRSEPVSIGGRPFHSPGTIIGKALEPLDKGVGDILVLLSLQ